MKTRDSDLFWACKKGLRYAKEPFLSEELYAIAQRYLDTPPRDLRALGHVMRALFADGLIYPAGFRGAKSSNRALKITWGRS